MRKDYGVEFEIETAVSESPTTKQPQAFLLQQSYPNPFNGEATLQFQLDQSGEVELASTTEINSILFLEAVSKPLSAVSRRQGIRR